MDRQIFQMKTYWRIWFNVKAFPQKKLSDEIKAGSQSFGTPTFLIQLDTKFWLQSLDSFFSVIHLHKRHLCLILNTLK